MGYRDFGNGEIDSSPYAAPIYQKLGFRAIGPEQVVDGLRFIPMEYKE